MGHGARRLKHVAVGWPGSFSDSVSATGSERREFVPKLHLAYRTKSPSGFSADIYTDELESGWPSFLGVCTVPAPPPPTPSS